MIRSLIVLVIMLMAVPALAVQNVTNMGSSVSSGQQTATTSAVALGSDTKVRKVLLQANAGNANAVWVGGSDVTSTTGLALQTGIVTEIETDNLTDIYIIGETAGGQVNWLSIVY